MTKRRVRPKGTGSVYPRKDGRFAASVTDPRTHTRRVAYAATEREAYDLLKRLQAEVARGVTTADARMTVSELLDRWLEEIVQPPRVSHGTRAVYRMVADRHVRPALGRLRIDQLTVRDVDRWLAQQSARGYAPATVQMHRMVLGSALKQALRWEILGHNVVASSRSPSVQTPHREVVDTARARRLLEMLRGDPLEPLYVVLLYTGLRISEALGLVWADVDLDAGIVRVQQQLARRGTQWVRVPLKTGAKGARELFVPPFVTDLLRAHRVRQMEQQLRGQKRAPWPLVFTRADGAPASRWTAWERWKRLQKRAGLAHLRVHDLRHAAATVWLEQGVEMSTISALLGHASLATTAGVYAQVSERLRRDAAKRMQDALGG